jgi:hypothetical protein
METPFAPTQTRGTEGDLVTLLPSSGGFIAANLPVGVSPFFRHDFFCAETPCIAPPANMTLWLPLDELTGPTSLNAAGGNPGVQHGSPVPTSGYVGGSLCFDGSTSYVEVQNYPAIDFGLGDFSIDAWVMRKPGDAGTRVIVDKRKELVGQRFFGYSFFLSDGELWFQLADGNYSNYRSTVTVPLDGQWHHVAVTIARGTQDGGRFYLDGLPVGQRFNPTVHAGSLASGSPLRVGSRSFSPSAVFQGCIDEVETFSRALGPSDVAALYGSRSNGKCKVSCQLPPVSSFCPGDASLSASATLCNSLATTASFSYDFQGLPVGASCTGIGPASFNPAVGAVVVPPGGCATLPVKIALPAGTLPFPQVGCYNLLVQSGAGSLAASCRGALRQGPIIIIPRFPPIFDCPLRPDSSFALPAFSPAMVGFQVRSEGGGAATSFPYRLSATASDLSPTSAISLDGQPPGAAIEDTLVLGPNTSTRLDVLATFTEYQPGRFFNVLLEGDLDGSGHLQPLSSAVLRNVIPSNCSAPLIVQPPTRQVITAGSPLLLSVVVENAVTATYHWRHNGVELAEGGTVSGANASLLKINPATSADAGLYQVVVATSCGAATSLPIEVDIASTDTACTPDPDRLCLNGGRFAVQAAWRTAAQAGSGKAVQVTGDTGYFWFFDPASIEVGVKVLDACSVSGRTWVFVGGLTDVEVTLTVTDTRTGAAKTYRNPLGQAFRTIEDIEAFATCPAAEPRPPVRPADGSVPSTALFLGGRFRVEALWQTVPGIASAGRAVPLTGGSGAFWFFDPGNLELFVKVLNGCDLGGHFWVYAGGLTDVQVDLTVTDVLTGVAKTYHSPRGQAFTPIQDTGAFSTCP